jgi:hypothetical protein
VPRLYELYPGICLTTEEKARKIISQGSPRVPVGRMKTKYTEQNIHNNTEVQAPRFHDSRHMKVVRLSALRTGRVYLS